MKGYMNGASADPVLNRMSAANSTSVTISGISHHFFSRHAKERHSLKSRHITAENLTEAQCCRNGIGKYTGLGVHFCDRPKCALARKQIM